MRTLGPMSSTWRYVSILLGLAVTVATVDAQDWPQLLGENRNGHYVGPPVDVSWDGGSPPELWRRAVGAGFAGPVVSGDRLILFHRLDRREVVEALETANGETVWRHEYPTSYRDDFGFDEGPRSVPVVADGRVFTFGAQGMLRALDLETGDLVWSVDTRAEFRFRKGFFGAAGSPLVSAGRVIANVGGPDAGIVAFDAATGDQLWAATDDEASYSSGIEADFGGASHVVFFTRNLLVGLDPSSGEVRFREPWRARLRASVNAATPIVVDDAVFVSAEYGPGAGVFRVQPEGGLEEVWRSNDVLSNHYATSVHRDGTLYGFHGRQEYGQSLRAVDLLTGDVHWSLDQFGAGTVLFAGDRLVVMRESGELLIADASPDGMTELASGQVLPAVVRAYPALAHGRLYVRNGDTLVCLDLRAP
jgi:outer membrane protein assembly factor BamB